MFAYCKISLLFFEHIGIYVCMSEMIHFLGNKMYICIALNYLRAEKHVLVVIHDRSGAGIARSV